MHNEINKRLDESRMRMNLCQGVVSGQVALDDEVKQKLKCGNNKKSVGSDQKASDKVIDLPKMQSTTLNKRD